MKDNQRKAMFAKMGKSKVKSVSEMMDEMSKDMVDESKRKQDINFRISRNRNRATLLSNWLGGKGR